MLTGKWFSVIMLTEQCNSVERKRSAHFITRRSTFTEKVCDRETDGGGLIVIQRRLPNGQENFVRNWADYENVFGDLNGSGMDSKISTP